MAINREKIADGAGNVAGLLEWNLLDTPTYSLFRRYKFPILTDWNNDEGERMDSSSYPKSFGKPYCIETFGVLTQAELLYMRTNFGRFVTRRLYNKATGAWANYNAEFRIERVTAENWRDGFWVNVRTWNTQLVVIP